MDWNYFLTNPKKKLPLIITFGGHKALGPAGPSVTPFEFKKSLVSIYGTEINYNYLTNYLSIEKSHCMRRRRRENFEDKVH